MTDRVQQSGIYLDIMYDMNNPQITSLTERFLKFYEITLGIIGGKEEKSIRNKNQIRW
ncbi:hypothetical protein CLV32_0068 [Pedobacter duraquae]|uniref:Uncharacterized protein n=1 Tax=Pedobacter duraquae TaxID=425511 RepID=A0A4R6INJ4_9SPHI|nr:hypothetical protein CLV32_0068 [Pedobacter duraquae]